MSEVKTNEPVKQEGDFKLKTRKKRTPKKLTETKDNITKVNINPKEPLVELEPEVKKVVIPKQEENAVQAQETNDSDVVVEESKDSSNSEGVVEEVRTTEEEVEESPIQLVEEKEEVVVQEEVKQPEVVENKLPENIEKLVAFMEETGGTIEDYTRLNADYSSIDDVTLLKEYYKKNKQLKKKQSKLIWKQ